jgi:hypothetical protein
MKVRGNERGGNESVGVGRMNAGPCGIVEGLEISVLFHWLWDSTPRILSSSTQPLCTHTYTSVMNLMHHTKSTVESEHYTRRVDIIP